MSIPDNIRKLRSEIPDHVSIVAVSKSKSSEDILEAYEAGQRIFGENRVQELNDKHLRLPEDIQWHMVGHLQSNKIKYIAGFVDLIHSVDSLKLLQAINREAKKVGRIIPCLLQVHIASEETKYGFTREEIMEVVSSEEYGELENIIVRGLMGMATFTDNTARVRTEFKNLAEIFDHLKNTCFTSSNDFNEISMGMSGDYSVAIEEGSTMVRLGTIIFGERNY